MGLFIAELDPSDDGIALLSIGWKEGISKLAIFFGPGWLQKCLVCGIICSAHRERLTQRRENNIGKAVLCECVLSA